MIRKFPRLAAILAFGLMVHAILAQQPLYIPDSLGGSVIDLELKQDSAQFFPGTITQTMSVNGSIPGPTLMLRRGEHVQINVTNNLGENTTIHWHGMHVSPKNDGGPHIIIEDSTTWSPEFTVLDWASMYWYHPHLHMHTNEHVQKGIAGMIIVKDSIEDALSLPRTYGVDDFPLAVQTKAFDNNNQVVVHSQADSFLLVNGTLEPWLEVPAQHVRFRLLNGASERTFLFGFNDNRTFYQIGSDGGLLIAPVAMTRLRLSPGERAEIVVDFGGESGDSIQLMNYGAELPNGIHGAAQPGMGPGQSIPGYTLNPLNGGNYTVLELYVVAATANAVNSLPAGLVSHNPWPASAADSTRQFTFSAVNMGPTAIAGPFVINNAPFDMMSINFEVPFENIEIWEFSNSTPIAHPFHVHNVHFYILDINGNPPPANMAGRKDVALIPGGLGTMRFITQFKTHFNDTLPYMYHCHMLTHEDDGMMGQFIVKAPYVEAVDEFSDNRSFSLFPNPVAGGQEVSIKGYDLDASVHFEVYNLHGQLLSRRQVSGSFISPQVPGIYLLRIQSKSGISSAILLVQ